jgi:acetoin utilization deacetylase AcuC-like enzyme
VKNFAEKICGGRRYAVLEGGYNHEVLGKNVKAFIKGLIT